uniref:Uncharacterized protein n=1 Tax=Vespula pensylvanica TaxID=30213 RepID=A0A834NWN4_VESPE|nr:hypothetical protein H0235_010220 [Vespula pensylvanica]
MPAVVTAGPLSLESIVCVHEMPIRALVASNVLVGGTRLLVLGANTDTDDASDASTTSKDGECASERAPSTRSTIAATAATATAAAAAAAAAAATC